ncbi:MAG: cation transporter [Planctomycetaceae bacterium]|nr:cation transporter [Planctomycetaceae bacterium]
MHQHSHSHQHERSQASTQALRAALVLNAGYMLVEFVGGILTGSLALVADAGHMLTDVAALALGLFALWFAQRPADPRRTFGYLRAETLAALANGITLLLISGYVLYEAWHRLSDPSPVAGAAMLAIAIVGLLVNLLSAWMLAGGHDDDLNRRGVYLHMLADALGSVGAIGAGAVILLTGWNWADPLASVLIVLLILWGTWHLLSDSIHVLMQGAPARISLDQVAQSMRDIPGVLEVHDLHVWTLGAGNDVMTGHAVLAAETDLPRSQEILALLREMMHDRFGIEHATIQLEFANARGNCDDRRQAGHAGLVP